MTLSKKDSPKTPMVRGVVRTPIENRIDLEIRNLGEIPSFKNSKRIVSRNYLATRKDVKRWMMQATASIAYQLMCAARTKLGETSTEQQLRSWIASFVPLDDARQVIVSLCIDTCDVPVGEEGADILIEKLQ